jgi:hypothetical protein
MTDLVEYLWKRADDTKYSYEKDFRMASDRIEQLETAIHDIMDAWCRQQQHRAFELAKTDLGEKL